MEFWGVEVKTGESLKVDPGMDRLLHLSQASLGETKKDKGSEGVLFVKFNDQKLVLGNLSQEKFPQIQFDLVFEKEFELSHSSKTSIYFCGYKTIADPEIDDEDDDFDESDEESDEEAIKLDQAANGKVEAKNQQVKPSSGKPVTLKSDTSAAKAKSKAEELKKDDKPKRENGDEDEDDDDDSDDDDEFDMEDDSDDDEEMAEGEDDSSDEEVDESSDEDEETPVKAKAGDKRSASAQKTPAPEKKAKLLSPAASQKSGDGSKKVHTATPHPAKQGGKADKSKQQTPKSGGSVSCKSCSKTFNSEKSLQDHAKAKHGAAK